MWRCDDCDVGKGSILIQMHLTHSHHQPNYFLHPGTKTTYQHWHTFTCTIHLIFNVTIFCPYCILFLHLTILLHIYLFILELHSAYQEVFIQLLEYLILMLVGFPSLWTFESVFSYLVQSILLVTLMFTDCSNKQAAAMKEYLSLLLPAVTGTISAHITSQHLQFHLAFIRKMDFKSTGKNERWMQWIFAMQRHGAGP